MKISIPLTLLTIATGTLGGDCVASGFGNECVSYFSDGACSNYLGSYKPTCAGNCFQYSFNSISVQGNDIFGTDCTAYYDDNCQQSIGTTGNNVNSDATCTSFDHSGGAKSMKCYFDC